MNTVTLFDIETNKQVRQINDVVSVSTFIDDKGAAVVGVFCKPQEVAHHEYINLSEFVILIS